jgi:hypothetical protein
MTVQTEFLMDGMNVKAFCLCGEKFFVFLSPNDHHAGIGFVYASNKIDESRFARAVFADERMELARPNIEPDGMQHRVSRERFAQSVNTQDIIAVHSALLRNARRVYRKYAVISSSVSGFTG